MSAKRTPAHYTVEGSGTFPIDMLRYDRATPATESDSSLIESTFLPRNRANHVVRVQANEPLTVARWESFGWKVRQ